MMHLPFRRRHHDDEASHDRARLLLSDRLDAPLGDAEEAWLSDHLARCPECAADEQAYLADQGLLRALRSHPPSPPRDLWARTAAAIERDAARPATGRPAARDSIRGLAGQVGRPPASARLPLGILSAALVAALVLVVALLPPGGSVTPALSPGATSAIRPTLIAGPTPVPIADANRVGWVEQTDGGYAIVFAPVEQACPASDPTCASLAGGSPAPLQGLAAAPQSVVLSPDNNQVAVVGGADTGDGVIIVPVATPRPSAPAASATAPGSSNASVIPTPKFSAAESSATTSGATAQPSAAGPESAHAIIRDVDVVGAAAYSADGSWLAFSARPVDGSGGPYLFVWHVGDAAARRMTDDGMTYVAGWYGDQVVVSQVSLPASAVLAPDAAASGAAGSSEGASPETPQPAASGSLEPGASQPPVEVHPSSFLVDPTSGATTAFRMADVWMPSIDPTGRFVAYWSGTLTPVFGDAGSSRAGQVVGWRGATGQLVLDGWSAPLAEAPTAAPVSPAGSTSPEPSTSGSSQIPSASDAARAAGGSTPPLAEGPAGTPIELAAGPLDGFDVRFDPSGTRLAVWVADPGDLTTGRLWLEVLDPAAGGIQDGAQPLPSPGVAALRGFSMDTGRLGWVTPPGQDGQPSSVQVLAWTGDAFGQVQTAPGDQVQIIR